MAGQLFLKKELMESLDNGIVCLKEKIDDAEDYSHFFFTKNKALIEKHNEGYYESLSYKQAFDILNKKVIEIEAELFAGEVHSVATTYIPDEKLSLKDAFVYMGNKSGAIVISQTILDKFSNESLEDFGIKDDLKSVIIPVCLGLENDTLEDIYILREE